MVAEPLTRQMTFTDDQIEIRPGHQARRFQTCDYFVGDVHLFHERTYCRILPQGRRISTPAELLWLAGGIDLKVVQWLPACGSLAEIEELAKLHGGQANEEPYAEGVYFLAFGDTEKALAFCRTEDFDRLCLTVAKL